MNILHTSLRVAAAMLVAVTAIGPTSCNDDNKGPQVPTNTIYNVVTLASRTDKGVTFTYQANYDKPVYTYVASGYQLNEKKFDVGCRLLLAYVPQNGDALASGDITVWGVSPIFNGKLTYGNQEAYKNWGITELGVSALWMTEGWLNINAKFPTQGAPTNFQLVCDQATANGPDADVYMIFTPERPNMAMQQTYAAFDISALQTNPGVENIVVHVANLNGPDKITLKVKEGLRPS